MTEQNWEYCELWLENWKSYGGGLFGGQVSYGYDCSIRYYAIDGDEIRIKLAEIQNGISYNPFTKATAILGANGWELVSIQLGNRHGEQGSVTNFSLMWGNRVAFFKRPIVEGRKVDEPKLVL